MRLILKLNSRLSFLPPFTGGKKCLEFPDYLNQFDHALATLGFSQ